MNPLPNPPEPKCTVDLDKLDGLIWCIVVRAVGHEAWPLESTSDEFDGLFWHVVATGRLRAVELERGRWSVLAWRSPQRPWL